MNRKTPSTIELGPWLALLIGLSPAITDFVRGFAANYSPPSTLLAPVLIATCIWRRIAIADAPRRGGVVLIATGLLLELVGIASRTWTLEWLGFPIAVVGMSLWLGRPSWRVAMLAFGLVPVPVSVEVAFTPKPETVLLTGACAAWQALGVAFSCIGPVAHLGDRHLELQHADAGWTLAAVLAQLGWFLAVSKGASGARALRGALAFAAAAAVLQPLAVAVALGLLVLSSEVVARAWLAHGVWLACSAGALFGSGWRRSTALSRSRALLHRGPDRR